MANIKVSELPRASTLNDSDLIMIVQSNENKKLNGSYINEIKPYVLYSNNEGSTGNITLNDSVANYNYIKILYQNGDGYSGTTDLLSPENATTTLTLNYYNESTSKFMHWAGKIFISGTSITHTNDYYYENNNGTINAPQTLNYISIRKVIGYK